MKSLRQLLLVIVLFSSFEAFAELARGKRVHVTPKRGPTSKVDEIGTPNHRYRLNTGLGIHSLRSSGVVVGSQFGFAPNPEARLYFGPEFSFSLFDPGSILNLMATGWYELPFSSASHLGASLGLVAGVAFSSNLAFLPTTTYAAFVDLVIWQEVDDLVTLRGQFRPGIVGGYFSFVTNFNVSFRFF